MPRISEVERWCSVCRKSVHELSNMPESDARALLRAAEKRGRVCVNYEVDDRGRVLFRDHSSRGRGRSSLALAGLALAVTLAGCVGFEREAIELPDEYAPEYWAERPFQPIRAEPETEPPAPTKKTKAAAKPGQLLVLVVDSNNDQPIADAFVWVVSDSIVAQAWTAADGTHRFDDLEAGSYGVEVLADGYVWTQGSSNISAGDLTTSTFRLDVDLTVEPPPPRPTRQLTGDVVPLSRITGEVEKQRREQLLRLEAAAAAQAEAAAEEPELEPL